MPVTLYEHQLKALKNMKKGCVLCGGVGSGKSITAISYYYLKMGGNISYILGGEYEPMDDVHIKDLYIITTAKKRDSMEWDRELTPFLLNCGLYKHKVITDSWNNIKKYIDVKDAFFIFDEQRVVGSGAWTKSFLKITKHNDWILLSATPGDTWSDYIPLFVANGFFKNRTEFCRNHVVYSKFTNFPKVERYLGERKLERLRDDILVPMDFKRETIQHNVDIFCDYGLMNYKRTIKERFDFDKNEPIENASGLCYALRKIVNSDKDRILNAERIGLKHDRLIVFYTFDYELDILRKIEWGRDVAEWNGHKHEEIPKTKRWVYLVNYTSGSEGWNCTDTNAILFYSQTYSYRTLAQASGRIDRLNTEYKDLYFYHLKSKAGIDLAISRALRNKKQFNERKFARW